MVITSIFFKVPNPGEVKTRLALGVGPEAAANLATAFFLDTLDVVSSTPGLEPVVATTGELPDTLKAQIGCPIWRQGQGGLSERLERILGLALEQAPYAMALGAPRWFGAITPFGGVLLLTGWGALGVFAARR